MSLILPRSAVGLRVCISDKFPVMLVLLVPGPTVTVRPSCVDSPHHTYEGVTHSLLETPPGPGPIPSSGDGNGQ